MWCQHALVETPIVYDCHKSGGERRGASGNYITDKSLYS